MIHITSKTCAHISAQIRAKQLSTQLSQDNLNAHIIEALEDIREISGEVLLRQIIDNMSTWLELVKEANASFAAAGVNNIGHPILHNKTTLQLQMALDWVQERGARLIKDLENGIFYHALPNSISIDTLPALQAPADTAFWGNENSSVSTILLYSIDSILSPVSSTVNLMGAATFYPFFKEGYIIDGISNNPFVFDAGMLLFGDYQFGAHRYFSNEYPNLGQRLFAPEDCSTAVGKASNLEEQQIVSINTTVLKNAYHNPENAYGYQAITSSCAQEKLRYDMINPGDIYVKRGHTAIISNVDYEHINTLEFNRDIDISSCRILGGGTYRYNIGTTSEVYILRAYQTPLKETCGLADLLARVDRNYHQFCQQVQQNPKGDCEIFLSVGPEQSSEIYDTVNSLTTVVPEDWVDTKFINNTPNDNTYSSNQPLVGDAALIIEEL